MKARLIPWYGWSPDSPDRRDLKYVPGVTGASLKAVLPTAVDLRDTGFLPPVFDQGSLGSCTANALAALFYFADRKSSVFAFMPSRLFIYYNERVIENTVTVDAGAELRDGIKTIVSQGSCLEALWPYEIGKFAEQPPSICYLDAKMHQATVYRRIVGIDDMRDCLAEGYPFVGGITVYDSFESDAVANSGSVPMPAANEGVLGGHAVLFVGYNDDKQEFIGMNSWNVDWGQRGFFTIPYDYLDDSALADDFWMVHSVTDGA